MTVSIVAVANMKGGVGKTTISAAFAEGSAWFGKTTLVVDLDPQINLSMALLGYLDDDPSEASEPWKNGQTVVDFLRGQVKHRSQALQPEALLRRIGDSLHLLPGSPEIIEFERHLLAKEANMHGAANAANSCIRTLLAKLGSMFDLILFDMPPGLSLTAESVLGVAQLIVVPQSPDRLSSQGLQLYRKYLQEHVGIPHVGERTCVLINQKPKPLTVVARNRIEDILADAGKRDFPYRVFQHQLDVSKNYRDAMGHRRPGDFNKLWKGVTSDVEAITVELWKFLGHKLG